MKKILMRIYSIKELKPGDRNDYIRLIDGDVDRKSIIEKFCKAFGIYGHRWHSDYIPEYGILFNQYFFNKPNEIFTIVAPCKEYKYIIGDKVHDSYNTIDILLKFQSYLYSIFRNEIYIEFCFDDRDIPRKYFLAAHFLYTINGCYDTEISLSHPLSKKEQKWLESILNIHFEDKVVFDCYFL